MSSEREADIVGLTSDSRKVEPGWVFYALPGVGRSGEEFIPEAIKKGAIRIVCESPPETGLPEGVELKVVPDAREAFYRDFCRFYRISADDFEIVAITGTNGKTTISYMISHLLREDKVVRIGTVDYALGTKVLPSQTTTPSLETLLGLLLTAKESGIRQVVMEASSHGLSQGRLGGLKVDCAIFTNLTRDHLDYHRDMEDYFQAKRRLFEHHLKDSGIAVVNVEDDWGRRLADHLRGSLGKRLIAIGKGGDVEVKRWRLSLQGGEAVFTYRGKDYRVEVPMLGRYNLINAITAVIAVSRLSEDRSIEDLCREMRTFPGVPGRVQRVEVKDRCVFVDYAHTPDGLETVLKAIRSAGGFERLFCVFGCGGDRDRGKRPLMGRIASDLADVVVVTSDNPRTEDPEKIIDDILLGVPDLSRVVVEVDRRKAIYKALDVAGPLDVVLIAGKGHEDYQIIGHTKYPFSDVEVVREWARGR